MRRVISIAMVIFGLAMVVTGIWKLIAPYNTEFYPPHVINAFIFGVLMFIHIWLNRKPILRYFKKLRWWWILVGLGFAAVVWVGTIGPISHLD